VGRLLSQRVRDDAEVRGDACGELETPNTTSVGPPQPTNTEVSPPWPLPGRKVFEERGRFQRARGVTRVCNKFSMYKNTTARQKRQGGGSSAARRRLIIIGHHRRPSEEDECARARGLEWLPAVRNRALGEGESRHQVAATLAAPHRHAAERTVPANEVAASDANGERPVEADGAGEVRLGGGYGRLGGGYCSVGRGYCCAQAFGVCCGHGGFSIGIGYGLCCGRHLGSSRRVRLRRPLLALELDRVGRLELQGDRA
jgi:hypothetical protein